MKNSKLIIAALSVCMFVFAGCQKEHNGVVSFKTELERVGANSKIFMNDNHIPQFFSSGESVMINNASYEISAGRLTDVAAVTAGYYYAVYPASIVTADAVTASTTIKLPHLQTWYTTTVGSTTRQKINLPCAAKLAYNGGKVLRFYNLCSLIEVEWTNHTGSAQIIRSVEVTAVNKGLWGTGTALIDEANSKISIPYNGQNSRVVLEMPSGISVADGSTSPKMYVIVPPYEDGTPFSVKINFNDGDESVEVNYTSIQLDRNSIYWVSQDSDPEEDTEISGYYSISPDCKVVFSKGNLQHRGGIVNAQSYQTGWHFADHQYDYYGNANVNGSFEEQLGENVDLFSWSCDDELWYYNHQYDGVHSYGLRSQESSRTYLGGDFADWGELEIDGDPAKTWFTMTSDEWDYLLNDRPGASGLRINVNITGIPDHPTGQGSVHGALIFPDDWTIDRLPSDISLQEDVVNNISYSDFRRIEAVGCVLLPQCGYRDVAGFHNNIIGTATTYNNGYYWTSDYAGESNNEDEATYIEYTYNATNYVATGTTRDGNVVFGCAVRLVKPAPGYTYANANRSSWGPSSK